MKGIGKVCGSESGGRPNPRAPSFFHGPSNEHAAPTELENDQGALAAIDMALLRSFSRSFMVTMHVQSETNFSTILAVRGVDWRAEPSCQHELRLLTVSKH